jgi:hypothetical protein
MCRKCPINPGQHLLNYAPTGVDFGDLGEVRKLLPHGHSLSNEQVADTRDLVLRVADAIYDRWLRKRVAGQSGDSSHYSSEGDQSLSP